MKKIIYSFIWIITFQFIGFSLGQVTKLNLPWYTSLVKSALTPANIVFPIVWSILYVLLALVGYFLWQRRTNKEVKLILIFYILQLMLNWAWTPIFFGLHLLGWACLLITILSTITTIIILRAQSNYSFVAYTMIAYLFWLLFAAYLNFMIWRYN